jgi:hypothetical protein
VRIHGFVVWLVVRRAAAVRCLIAGPSHPICLRYVVSADRKQTSNTIAICERIINGRFIITSRMQLLTLMPLLICQCQCHSLNLAKRSYSASGLQHCEHGGVPYDELWAHQLDRILRIASFTEVSYTCLYADLCTLLIVCPVIMVDKCIQKLVTRLFLLRGVLPKFSFLSDNIYHQNLWIFT